MAERSTLTLTIMGRDYRLSVSSDEEDNLRRCAQMVEERMKEINKPGHVFTPDAVAVLAALRIAYELLNQQQIMQQVSQVQPQLQSLIDMCESAIKKQP